MSEPTTCKPRLVRAMGFWMLTAYGVGDILGAGIYALIGEIADVAGSLSWLSFLLAGIVAGLTGLSYAELGSRFPFSGGESYFMQQAFQRPRLSFLTGWLVFCSGLVSMATIARAFAGYAGHLIPSSSESLMVSSLVIVLALIALVGIRISSSANAVCTVIESTGLLLVAGAASVWLINGNTAAAEAETIASAVMDSTQYGTGQRFVPVLQGAALAFFAFVGFEDMVNVAEEVHEPERTMPRAVLTSITIAVLVYVVVVFTATQVVAPAMLATSDAPLLMVMEASWPQFPLFLFSIIALFAVANTGLANFVTSSRLIFGMSEQKLLPAWIGRVNAKTRTPDAAIAVCFVVGLCLALWGSLSQLAGATSCLILTIFALMNLGLILIQRRSPRTSGFRTPTLTPFVALVSCVVLLCFVSLEALTTAAVIVAVGVAFAFARKQPPDASEFTTPA